MEELVTDTGGLLTRTAPIEDCLRIFSMRESVR
jgi:hypothetical protein